MLLTRFLSNKNIHAPSGASSSKASVLWLRALGFGAQGFGALAGGRASEACSSPKESKVCVCVRVLDGMAVSVTGSMAGLQLVMPEY